MCQHSLIRFLPIQSETQDYPQGMVLIDGPDPENPTQRMQHPPSTKDIQERARSRVCGVVIHKGSKTTDADIDSELCSKHRPKER